MKRYFICALCLMTFSFVYPARASGGQPALTPEAVVEVFLVAAAKGDWAAASKRLEGQPARPPGKRRWRTMQRVGRAFVGVLHVWRQKDKARVAIVVDAKKMGVKPAILGDSAREARRALKSAKEPWRRRLLGRIIDVAAKGRLMLEVPMIKKGGRWYVRYRRR